MARAHMRTVACVCMHARAPVRRFYVRVLLLCCVRTESNSEDRARCAQPETIPGDIIFVIQQKEHTLFKRKGARAAAAAAPPNKAT